MDSSHPAHIEALLAGFDFWHMARGQERDVMAAFARLADRLADGLPDSPQLADGLRSLALAQQAFARVAPGASPVQQG